MKFIKSLYIHNQFYIYIAVASVCFLLSYWFPALFSIATIISIIIFILFVIDISILYGTKQGLNARRLLPDKFSNSDPNPVPITIKNTYSLKLFLDVIDELPEQFQKRDFSYQTVLNPNEIHDFEYLVRPVDRGEYYFGHLNIFASSLLKIVKRKYQFQNQQMVMVYPSIIQMQKYDFLAISNHLTQFGLKKIRRIGNTSEFEQIKDYVQGDDFRTVNWKATAKRAQLMVNQYQDEKSQPIYSIIDTGRVMKMPFNELKLVDYAINSTLAFSNVALKKHDKVGLLAFSKKIENYLPALSKLTYLNRILETLYNIDTQFNDSDFGLLYAQIKRKITHRGLLLLYTNFEHLSALKRQMPYLQAISKKHMLVVVLFENTELNELIHADAENLQTIYHKTIAEKFAFEKRLMVKELQKHGIQSILTPPEKLTVNTINKYLEIKARGLL
ncbi:DUF58 domain-containing protein [Winogradskyella immobilis]|uniref:DUF58 domain-containing protein n=1 Tax=Winogradskyella immobilis TaxID=2816852 RepID=A0ABS8EP94_9FLAO|nr:DUF58 domain-containing protein [Winogradskyella immobilis]MCC1484978.1 DUF58 domain-containing protein [Winogradskyella immobilis]MCG0017070.1 DUF58 domain-containing protein [Winogradskyella immobilis]